MIANLLLSPSRHISDEQERSRARILSALLLGRLVAVVAVFLFLDRRHELSPVSAKFVWLAIANTGLAYGLSRWRFYKGACLLVAVESTFGISAACIQDASLLTITQGTMWFGLAVLICSLVLSLRYTLTVVFATIFAFGVIRAHVPVAMDTPLVGSFIYFMASSALILVGIFLRDSAERKLALERLRLAQAAKLTALGEMAGGVAHEVNNPLAILGALASEIRELAVVQPVDQELLVKLSQTQSKTVDRIAHIIQGLRHFARDTSADPVERVNVGALLEDVLRLYADNLGREGIELRVDPLARNVFFAGHSVEISQVVVGLLSNARDALGAVTPKWIRVVVTQKAKWFEIRVMDSGSGVPVDIEEKLFQPFFTTKEVGRGMGLGLSAALGIVRSHGGELYLDRKSANTCFVVRLPNA